jgi:hypothetical protein
VIHDFHGWVLLFIRKLVDQGLLVVKKKSSLRMFYGHNHDLVYCYIIYVLQITTDIFLLSCLSFLVQNFRTWSPNITYHRIGNMNNAKSAKNGSEIAYLTRPQEFTPSFRGVKIAQYLFFCSLYFVFLFLFLFFFIFCHYIVLLAMRTTCIWCFSVINVVCMVFN